MTEVSRYWVNSDGYLYGCSPAWEPKEDELVMWPDFKRVQDERDALQQRLNAADQRNDELSSMLQHLVDNPYRFTDAYRAKIAATLKGETATPAPSQPFTEQFLEDHLGNAPSKP